ncbi:uncharacterized protein BP5553_06385 [Venustampulla echinocandica]|uniref:2EXR domain-containing protein n=1 Tax=Venustampulla echinocandica TaxID=2656787 RepID=A0A370TJS6_9HELO|nr:uncharacterized protein BP5553_06385 [Venustampulla echinocandica]RDL35773.1 hypothetical protein BP5553_06385 [Venustampulla echinocandica]
MAISISSFLPPIHETSLELRRKVWSFAVEARVLRVHLHAHVASYLQDEQTVEDGRKIYRDYPSTFRTRMNITPCNGTQCFCIFFRPKSPHTVPLPAVLFARHESRDVAIPMYSRRLDGEYDTRGVDVSGRPWQFFTDPLAETGLVLNPFIDTILVRANINIRSRVEELHHFAAIAALQVPDISKIIVDLRIGQYKRRSARCFQYWRDWGADSWWVPTRFLVQMRGLREVIFLRPPDRKMLPDEWVKRTEDQWVLEFLKFEEKWPVEWEGRMPSLKFIPE